MKGGGQSMFWMSRDVEPIRGDLEGTSSSAKLSIKINLLSERVRSHI